MNFDVIKISNFAAKLLQSKNFAPSQMDDGGERCCKGQQLMFFTYPDIKASHLSLDLKITKSAKDTAEVTSQKRLACGREYFSSKDKSLDFGGLSQSKMYSIF